ncbi:MAG: hypothetical protein GC150_13115 [Rhizobiales bacterium]|nr:hypothetical protein [Hyphomicrobiales bacterium]
MGNIRTPSIGRGFLFRRHLAALAAVFAFAPSLFVMPATANDMVNALLGSWGGAGYFRLDDGSSQRIRCTGYYTGGGNQLRMAILCNSDSNEIHMRGTFDFKGSQVSGSWEERTYNANGTVTGSVSPGRIQLSIGGSVTGTLAVSFTGRQQRVLISTQGTALRAVDIQLTPR